VSFRYLINLKFEKKMSTKGMNDINKSCLIISNMSNLFIIILCIIETYFVR